MNYFKATFNGAPCVLITSNGWFSIAGSTFANKLSKDESLKHGVEVLELNRADITHSNERFYTEPQVSAFIGVHHAANDLENNAISESTFDVVLERYRQANADVINPIMEQAKIIKRRHNAHLNSVAVITLCYNFEFNTKLSYQYHFDKKERVRIGNTIKDDDSFYRVVVGIYHFDTKKLELYPHSTQKVKSWK